MMSGLHLHVTQVVQGAHKGETMSQGSFNSNMTFGKRKQIVDQFKRVLSELSYKRFWEFSINYDLCEGVVNFCMTQLVEDITSDREYPKTTKLSMFIPIELGMWQTCVDDVVVKQFIRQCIIDFEMHEVNEWLKYKGVCVQDPHPEFIVCKKCGMRYTVAHRCSMEGVSL